MNKVRTLSNVSNALTGLGNRKVGKNSKASSELCKFLGVPDQSRSETALLISKFIKLYNARVHILSLPFYFLHGGFCFIFRVILGCNVPNFDQCSDSDTTLCWHYYSICLCLSKVTSCPACKIFSCYEMVNNLIMDFIPELKWFILMLSGLTLNWSNISGQTLDLAYCCNYS